ncbi:ankyrin repeat domain-containing protein, partial [Pseudomonadota bacterium]
MPRYDRHRFKLTPAVYALARALCVVFVLAALSIPGAAQAQEPQDLDRANQALFMAVDRNDLPGVRAAIQAGADIEATGYSSMPAVDLAIDRGYFDIAHYLISVRNARAAGDKPPAPTPSPEQLAEASKAAPEQQAPTVPTAGPTTGPTTGTPTPAPAQVKDSPFDAPRAAGDLPVVESAAPPPAPAAEVAEVAEAVPEKKSAAKTFVTTFFNFFDEPNTTGVVHKPRGKGTGPADAVTETELSKQLKEIEAERGDDVIKGPAVPISPEELAKQLPPAPEVPDSVAEGLPLDTPELPPYALEQKTPERTITAPPASGEDPFG